MFDYTAMLIHETIKDIKNIGNIAKYSTQGVYIVYLVYALIAGTGFWFINAPLLVLAVAYLIYDLHSTNHKNKQQDKKVRRLFSRIRRALKAFPLCVSLYSLYLTIEEANAFTLITTAFMLISWTLAFIFDILVSIVEKRIELFKVGFNEDLTNIFPVKSVGNIIKKATGQPVQAPTPTKTQALLQKKFEKHQEIKKKEQAEKAQQRKEEFEKTTRRFLRGVKNVLNGNNSNTPPSNDDGEDEND